MPTAPPGWYPGPSGTMCYWDGARWVTQEASAGHSLIAVSYVSAVVLPIVGIVLGGLLIQKRSLGNGIAVIALSALVMLFLVLVQVAAAA